MFSIPTFEENSSCRSFTNSKTPAAKTDGNESKNENRAAVSRFNPTNNPPVIVVPERDEPGINATA